MNREKRRKDEEHKARQLKKMNEIFDAYYDLKIKDIVMAKKEDYAQKLRDKKEGRQGRNMSPSKSPSKEKTRSSSKKKRPVSKLQRAKSAK